MRTFKVIIVVATLALAGSLPLGLTAAQPAAETPPGAPPVEVVGTNGDLKIKLNFQDTPLQAVLEYLSETAGLTVVSEEPLVDGRMTVISRQPIALTEAVSLINSILKEKGLTTILRGKTLKVVSLAKAKVENIPVLTGRDPDAIEAGDNVVTYVVPVGHVTAKALKDNLQALIPDYASLEANEDGNALIITDTTANIKRLVQIVRALDTHMSAVAEIRVFRLTSADATSAATLINNIFEQDQSSSSRTRQGASNPMEMMMRRMARRGGPGGPGGDDSDTSGSTGSGVNVQVVAAADERTNSVVVRGPGEIMSVVNDLIVSLDDTTIEVAGVKVFQLRYADAMNVAEVVNTLFGDEQSSQDNQAGARMFRGLGGGGPFGGAQQTQQDDTNSSMKVTAAADSQTNTVVVTGPDKMLDIVAQVVEKLDSQLPNVADVKVFHLEYADAQDTADLINEVFGESGTSRTSRSSSQQNQQVQFMRGGFGPQQQQQTSQGGSDIAVIAAADSLTNSVVVSGPAETLAIIADVIKELDENPEQERQIFVYPLKNADATNLMEILNSLFEELQALNQQGSGTTGQQFQGGQRGVQQPGGTTSSSSSTSTATGGANDLDEETYFQADTDTNSLLTLTSTKNYERVRPIIDELDKPVGQVLIKVLFAELSHSNSVDLGTEFSMLNLRSDGDFTQTDSTFGTPLSGLSVRTVEGDLDVTLSALQETGRLNVLSRPYVLTRNNQTATISVGEEVPIPTGTSQGTATTTTTFDYRDDIGIVLNVTPSINREGLVNMIVTPQITTRTGETVQISEDLFPEVFATRSADTRVAVRDGQTIVIGGLIEDQLTDTVRKIPLLGDIPLAGALFRRTIKEKSKTELLIFLTPHVAKEAADLTPISDAERERSSLQSDESTAEIFRKHMEGMQGPTVINGESREQ